jgi:hypothetical protein
VRRLQKPQLARPIGQAQAQPLDIRVAGEKLRFDGRNLLAAASDSCWLLSAFLGDLVERPAIAVKRGFLAGQRLVALDYDVDVLWIQLEADADAFGQLRSRSVVPDPRKGSKTRPPRFRWFSIGRRIRSTGFCVG